MLFSSSALFLTQHSRPKPLVLDIIYTEFTFVNVKCLDVVMMASSFSFGEVGNSVQKLHLSFKTARMRSLSMVDPVSAKEIK